MQYESARKVIQRADKKYNAMRVDDVLTWDEFQDVSELCRMYGGRYDKQFKIFVFDGDANTIAIAICRN